MEKARLLLLAFAFLLVCSQTATAESLDKKLGSLLHNLRGGGEETEILDPDQAFIFSAEVTDARHIKVHWDIARDYYLYRDKFSFTINNADVSLRPHDLPPGDIKQDPYFGNVAVFHNAVDVLLPLDRRNRGETSIDLAMTYQGCKENTICYPPIKKNVSLLLPAFVGTPAFAADKSEPITGKEIISSQDRISNSLRNNSVLVNMLVFFGFGLLLAFTPCIFPMIPILSGIIVGQGNKLTPGYAFLLSFFYVIAMALTYAVLGVIAGSFQINLQAASQNTWIITAFSLVFVLLALSMFGFYELQMPAGLQNYLDSLGRKQQQGSLIGSGVMGLLSAIIVGPCVAPPLAGALIYISQTGNAVLGGAALFSMGLGMGAPLLVIGTSAGKLLPRAGMWMTSIKKIFGVILLGVAIWFLGRILPGPLTLFLWGLLLVTTAAGMGALNFSSQDTTRRRLAQGIGIVLMVYGITLIVGAASGGTDVFRPLQGISGNQPVTSRLEFTKIKSIEDLNEMLTRSEWDQKTVMLDFYADWCPTCKEMERFTFPDPAVQAALAEVLLLKADVTENNDTDQALMKHFGIIGPPAILFFVRGKEHREFRLVGFVDAESFVKHIHKLSTL